MKGYFSTPWPQFLGLLFFVPVIALRHHLHGPDRTQTFMDYALAILTIALSIYMLRVHWKIRQSKTRASQWKQRIQQIADRTDAPYETFTFDDFCDLTDDSELERTLEFLAQMPKGQRNLKEAYAQVLEKYGGPL